MRLSSMLAVLVLSATAWGGPFQRTQCPCQQQSTGFRPVRNLIERLLPRSQPAQPCQPVQTVQPPQSVQPQSVAPPTMPAGPPVTFTTSYAFPTCNGPTCPR